MNRTAQQQRAIIILPKNIHITTTTSNNSSTQHTVVDRKTKSDKVQIITMNNLLDNDQHDTSSMSSTTRRRRKRAFSSTAALLIVLSLAGLTCRGEAFGIRKVSRRIARKFSDSERFADKSQADTTWSKSASRKSSPLQVRKRVKAVLEKAKSRTGVTNSATSMSSTLADAASIGGITDSDFVLGLNNTLNVYSTERNGNGVSVVTATSNNNNNIKTVSSVSSTAPNGSSNGKTTPFKKPKDFDALVGDVPAANAFTEPLPFELPKLTPDQRKKLNEGERIQEQARMGREGSGFVVLDVKAPPYVVWECLLDFESYPETIPTVREMQLYTSEKLNIGYVNEKPVLPGTGRETRHYGTPSITRAKFVLSKFKLNIAAVHQYTPHPEGDYMEFNLDKSCTNMVLKGAKGIWYTEENPDGKEGYTRVYLLCEVQISRALPSFIVDYAADRAMPRATTWLRPLVETAADLWLKKPQR